MLMLWGAAGRLVDVRSARRIYPALSGAAVVGAALGALVAGPVARSVGGIGMMLTWALLALVALACLASIRLGPSEVAPLNDAATGGGGLFDTLQSGLVRALALAMVLLVLILCTLVVGRRSGRQSRSGQS